MGQFSPELLAAKGWNLDGTRINRAIGRPKSGAPGAEDEGELHNQILAYCRAKGWSVVHSRMDVPQTAGVGTPDFVIALPNGVTIWIEAKAKKRKPSMEQLAWIATLKKLGHRAAVVWSFEQFLEIVK